MVPTQPDPALSQPDDFSLKESLFEPETHVTGSPFTVVVSPGEAFGRRSDVWGDALSNITAGAAANLSVRARDVVGNAIWEGGSELAVYAFHQRAEVRCAVMSSTFLLAGAAFSYPPLDPTMSRLACGLVVVFYRRGRENLISNITVVHCRPAFLYEQPGFR